jgi:glutaredoxin 3
MPRIELYSSPWCPWCWKSRLLLRSKGVHFAKIPIRMFLGVKLPTANLRRMVQRTGGDSTVPQIFVDGHYLGTDDTLEELDRAGRLDDILAGHTPVPDDRFTGQ